MNTGSAPYPLFLHFVHKDGFLYLHCAHEGRKLDLLRADPRVGFTACTEVRVLRETFSTHYRSVCGVGTVEAVTDPAELHAALAAVADKYEAACPRPTPRAMLARMAVLRIRITAITGKHSPD